MSRLANRLFLVIAAFCSDAQAANPNTGGSEKQGVDVAGVRNPVLASAIAVQAKDVDGKHLRSADATIEFERTVHQDGDTEPRVLCKGTQEMLFEADKYRFGFKGFWGPLQGPRVFDERVFLLVNDVEVLKATFCPRINPSGCRVEYYNSLKAATWLPVYDPRIVFLGTSNLSAIVNAKGEEHFEVRPGEGGGWEFLSEVGNSPEDKITTSVDPAIGYRIVRREIRSKKRGPEPYWVETVKWKQADSVWYVEEYTLSYTRTNMERHSTAMKVTAFKPNVELLPEVFQEASLPIPGNAHSIDRR